MKLRNKKTGIIIEPDRVAVIKKIEETGTAASFNRIAANYYSLAKLNEEWEDYEPKEPLIKDEKIRKAIRAWAEINLILDDDDVEASTPTVDCNVLTLTYGTISIDVFVNDTITIINHGHYTIAELCGEGEE